MTDLTQAIAGIRDVTPIGDEWTARDFSQRGHASVDKHLAVVINAALSGELIPLADAKLAAAEAYRKAAKIVSRAGHSLDVEIRALADTDALAEVRAFTVSDGQRLLQKRDVAGVCDDPDLCFENVGSTARCGPCAAKLAAKAGIELNQYTASNPQAMRLQRELAALRAQVERLTGALGRAQRALKPFADRVFNDNGDCTISDTHTLTPSDYWNAQSAERIAIAALTEGAAP